MCRGDHWSPANLAQQRVFRGSCFTDKRARASNARPNKSFFDSLKYTSCSRPRWRTKLLLFRKTAIKNTPQLLARYLFGAPCGSKPEHFCVSGRHRHHTAAPPEVMPVVPPRKDKRGVLKYQGAFAAYPRSTNWAVVFHSPLDISPSLFFRLIAEQPTSPYPGGITESKSKHGTCLVQ